MKRLIDIIIAIIVLVVGMTIGYRLGASGAVDVGTDTIFVYDTIVKTQPVVVSSGELGNRSYRVKLLGRISKQNDSISKQNDSVEVQLPIVQKVYGDSTYRAWVSGYDARLDSFQIYQPTRYITITTTEQPSRWSWGVQVGMGITPKGMQPYIGLGGQFKF